MWQLKDERVMRLAPRETCYLRGRGGMLWVALGTAPGEPRGAAVDHILAPGERLLVKAGQTAVVSSAGRRGSEAWFDWQPRPVAARTAPRWRAAALQAFAQFGLSAALAR